MEGIREAPTARSSSWIDVGQENKPAAHSRSRRGCLICRRRKVKCDERRASCGNCERLGLHCEYESSRRPSQRSRGNRACARCRAKKAKCSSSLSYGPCDQCRRGEVSCSMETTHGSSVSFSTPSTDMGLGSNTVNTSKSNLPQGPELHRLLEAYFTGPHHFCFYTHIHQPTFMQMLGSELIPRSLLLIVCATSLRFTNPASRQSDLWADECRQIVTQQIFSLPSMTTLQTLLLLQRYEWYRGSHISAWFLAGLAIRLTHSLQLNVELSESGTSNRNDVPVTVKETRRRLMWSCFVMESFTEAGKRPLSGLRHSAIETKLPCGERSFYSGIESEMEDLTTFYEKPKVLALQGKPPSKMRGGISAFLISIAVLRLQILEYSVPYHPRNEGRIPSQAPWDLDAPFHLYRQRLDDWERLLPSELKFNEETLRNERPHVISLMVLHCLFHGCYCDLYRIASYLTASECTIDTPPRLFSPPSSFLQHCQRGRFEHAFAIASVISDSLPFLQTASDPVLSICACLSLRVLTLERRQDDSQALGLSEHQVSKVLACLITTVKATALRCEPIRKLLIQICKQADRRGYHVDLSDIERPSSLSSQPTSRQPSPSLMTTYGTFATIQGSLAKSDIYETSPAARSDGHNDPQSANSTFSPNEKTEATPMPVATTSRTEDVRDPIWGNYASNTQDRNEFDMLDPQTLDLVSAWADGSLEWSGTTSYFDWADHNLSLDTYGLDSLQQAGVGVEQ